MNKQGFDQALSQQDFSLLQKGKQKGFAAAYQLYADYVYSLTLYLVCDEEIARDLLQLTFEHLITHREELADGLVVGHWLKNCTIDACKKYFKQVQSDPAFTKKHGQFLDDADTTNLDVTVSQPSELATTELINQLPLAQRTMVYMHTVQNMKHRDIAKKLTLSDSGIGYRCRQAVNRFRIRLAKEKNL
ncbi:RNA polymerase sigma factor [Colwellia sp. MEBiC06753]